MKCDYVRRIGVARPLLALAALIFLFAGPGCEQKEEEPKQAAAPTESPVESLPPRPVTYELLQLMPEGTSLSLAIPPVSGLYAKAENIQSKLAGPGSENFLDIFSKELAGEAGVEEANTLPDILRAKGIDPDQPMAIFVDVTPLQDKAMRAGELAAKIQQPALEELEETPMAQEFEEAPGAEELDAPAEATGPEEDANTQETPAPEQAGDGDNASAMDNAMLATEFQQDLEELQSIALAAQFAAVVYVTDPAAAESMIAMMQTEEGPLESETRGDIELKYIQRDGARLYYFIKDGKLVLSNDPEMADSVALRMTAPASIRYGTPECPPNDLNEAVQLVRADQILPLVKAFLAGFAQEDPMMGLVWAQQEAELDKAIQAYSGSDPIVSTLAWTDERAELMTRVDLKSHPGAVEMSGEPALLKQPLIAPQNTMGLWTMRLTDEWKQQIQSMWLDSIPEGMADQPSVEQSMGMLKMALNMIGDEVTMIVHGEQNGMPLATIMVNLADPEATRNMLQAMLGLPMQPDESYKDVGIMQLEMVPTPEGQEIHFAFPGDTMLISNDLDSMRAIIDEFQAGETSGYLTSLEPALEPDVPRYFLLVLDDALLTDVLIPVLAVQGKDEMVEQLAAETDSLIDQIRVSSEVRGDWVENRAAVYFD